MHPMSAQLASAGGSAADALHGGQPALVLQPDVYAQLAKLLGLEPAAAALPVPAAFPVFSAAGALIPGLLTDGLGNFWQVVEDAADEVPDDPLNTRELEVAKGADALLDQLLAGYPDVLGDVAQAPAWVDKFGAPHGSASAGSGSPTAYSPASSAVDAASPASYADIDWDVYRSDEIDFAPASIGSAASGATLAHFDAVKTRPAAMYPQAVHAVHQEVAAYAVDGTAPAMSSIDGLYESVDTAAFFASLGGQARQPAPAPACGPLGHSHAHAHAHRNPLSTISHPSLSGSPDRSDRASPPRDDVSYPCPVPGCPASFRCASRGVVYSAARMQLLYSDSVAADRLGTGDEDGEVVSDRDCEFVRHLFAEHEAELSSKEPNPKTARPEKTWRCPLCAYRSKKCNVEAHMLSAGSGHHPAKHLYCAACHGADGRTVWLYNYQSAVNHFEERHGVRVGKRGPGRRKETVKGEGRVRRVEVAPGRGRREAGRQWEAPGEVDGEVDDEAGPAPTYKPILPRPPFPAGFSFPDLDPASLSVREAGEVPPAVEPAELLPAPGPEGAGWFVSPRWMVLEDGRAVQVVADAAEPKPREGGPARIVRPGRASGVQALGEFAEPFEIEGARFEALEGEEEVKVKSEPGTEAEEQPAAPAPTPAAAPAPSRTSSAAPPPAPTPTAAPAPVPEVDELAGQLEALDIATPPAPLASSRLSEVAQMLDGLGGEQLAALGKFLDSLRDGVRRAEGKLAATQQQADNASVVQLLEMGFDHADAVAALARCGGDAGRAVEDLLSRGAE